MSRRQRREVASTRLKLINARAKQQVASSPRPWGIGFTLTNKRRAFLLGRTVHGGFVGGCLAIAFVYLPYFVFFSWLVRLLGR